MTAIDLGALKNAQPAEDEGPIEVEAAFIVILRGEGVVQASPDINAAIAPQRTITLDEMQMAARKIAEDIQTEKAANLVVLSMRQAANQAFSAAEGQRIAQSLKI